MKLSRTAHGSDCGSTMESAADLRLRLSDYRNRELNPTERPALFILFFADKPQKAVPLGVDLASKCLLTAAARKMHARV